MDDLLPLSNPFLPFDDCFQRILRPSLSSKEIRVSSGLLYGQIISRNHEYLLHARNPLQQFCPFASLVSVSEWVIIPWFPMTFFYQRLIFSFTGFLLADSPLVLLLWFHCDNTSPFWGRTVVKQGGEFLIHASVWPYGLQVAFLCFILAVRSSNRLPCLSDRTDFKSPSLLIWPYGLQITFLCSVLAVRSFFYSLLHI